MSYCVITKVELFQLFVPARGISWLTILCYRRQQYTSIETARPYTARCEPDFIGYRSSLSPATDASHRWIGGRPMKHQTNMFLNFVYNTILFKHFEQIIL